MRRALLSASATAALCVIVVGRYDSGVAAYAPPVRAAVSAIADGDIILVRPHTPAAKPSAAPPAPPPAKRRPN